MPHSTEDRRLYQIINLKKNRLVVITPPHPLVDHLAAFLGARWETVVVNEKRRDAWVFHRDQRAVIEARLADLFDQPRVPLIVTFNADQAIHAAPAIDGYVLYDLHHQLLQRRAFQSPVVRDLRMVDEALQPAGDAMYPALRGRVVVAVRCRHEAEITWQDAKTTAAISITDAPSAEE